MGEYSKLDRVKKDDYSWKKLTPFDEILR